MGTNLSSVALVTGGSRGIGLGIARVLAREGWRLVINGMRPADAVLEAIAELTAIGNQVAYCQGDISSASDRERMIDAACSSFGQIDLLVNNAGITSPGRMDLLEATEESFDCVIDTNFKGALFLAQLAARRMIDQHQAGHPRGGCIVNISSISAHTSSLNRGDYCISRACTTQATRLLAAQLACHNINVYEVRPGIIRTDMTQAVTEKYDKLIAEGLTIEPRWGAPDDIGRAVAMLARGDITYAPGTMINVDGGLTLLQDLGVNC
ncbi:MAG: 3-ketoacyl-ACP reductase [Pirellulales bacterium]|nr:3-ketoacyl-ACP reductase [Pirellulales bacterium]